MTPREFGRITAWVEGRGFGFIRPAKSGGKDLFVHVRDVPRAPDGSAYRTLPRGQRVSYTVAEGSRGLYAVDVELLD
jgi:CspA family cold shock protein